MNAARASIVALLLCWAFAALADVAVPPLAGRRVVDQTGTLSPADADSLQQTIRAFETRKGSQVAVLIVPSTTPETIEQYSLRVAEAWKIGRRKFDDGVLLVIAKYDHKLRIEVGYGLEGALTDVTTKRIIDETIAPRFREGNYTAGISAGVRQILRIVDGEHLPAPPSPQQKPGFVSNQLIDLSNPLVIVAIMAIGLLMRLALGRLIGSIAAGGLMALVAWFAVGSLAVAIPAGIIAFLCVLAVDLIVSGSGGSGSSGWSSVGSGSWSGSSSSSGSGGWSDSGSSSDSGGGGGGNFGGGGASGDW